MEWWKKMCCCFGVESKSGSSGSIESETVNLTDRSRVMSLPVADNGEEGDCTKLMGSPTEESGSEDESIELRQNQTETNELCSLNKKHIEEMVTPMEKQETCEAHPFLSIVGRETGDGESAMSHKEEIMKHQTVCDLHSSTVDLHRERSAREPMRRRSTNEDRLRYFVLSNNTAGGQTCRTPPNPAVPSKGKGHNNHARPETSEEDPSPIVSDDGDDTLLVEAQQTFSENPRSAIVVMVMVLNLKGPRL